MPLRHPGACARRRGALHRRQPRAPAQPGCDLRQGCLGHHEAGVARAADAAAAAQARQRARRRRVRAHLLGAGLRTADRPTSPPARDRPEEVRAVHRARPDAGADGSVRAPVRHAELRGARRLLLGQHGGRNDLYGGRQFLGVRRPRPRPRQAVRDDRHRRGPPQQPDEDRHQQVQARGRALHIDQPGADRLLGHRRRVDPHQARHRRRAADGAAAPADRAGPGRPRLSQAFHECTAAGTDRRRRAPGAVRLRPRSGARPPWRRPQPA